MKTIISKNVSLRNFNSMKLEATAETMVFPTDEEVLCDLMNENKDKKIIIIGNGTNILLSEQHYSDDYLFINLKLLDKIYKVDGAIHTQAGADLTKLVWFSIENNISGFEFLEDIPGTIGGAIIMNAGTFKDYIGPSIKKVRYYDFQEGRIVEKTPNSNDFSKRSSFWAERDCIVLSCVLEGTKGDTVKSIEEVAKIKQDRFRKQPRNFPNAGSIFARPKNGPEGIRVWQMIDKVGLRGYKRNDAAFSEKHPGFIVNTGNAGYEDIIYLVELAKERVFNELGVELVMEWEII